MATARKVTSDKGGMNKDQIYQLAGRPHFAEGMSGVREWDYLFNFTGPEGIIPPVQDTV